MKKYTNIDKLNVIQGYYCNTKEIAILSNKSHATASKIKKEILNTFLTEQATLPFEKRIYITASEIPYWLVLQYLKINEAFIVKHAKIEREMRHKWKCGY